MKVTFLEPPVLGKAKPAERVFGCAARVYPIPNVFVLTAAAVLERAGHQVNYIDAAIKNWCHEEFKQFLAADDSDVYCFYSVNLSQHTDVSAVGLIRRQRGDVPIIFCGPAPSDRPDEFLLDSHVIVVRGEPEMILTELTGELGQKGDVERVHGISFFRGEDRVDTPSRPPIKELDNLPFPARHLVDRDQYFNPKLGVRPYTVVLTSRGCAHKCIYCVPCSLSFAREIDYKRTHKGKKPPVRLRSPENVIAEFKQLSAQGYKAITVIDDQFVWGKNRTLAICDGIKDLAIKWACLARADVLDQDIVRAMAEAGCQEVSLGVESFSQEILDYINKDLDVDTIAHAIRLLKKNNILAKLNILVGSSPLETKQTLKQTLKKALRARPDWVMFNICNPFPGTKFHDMAVENNWMVGGHYQAVDVQKQSIINYPHLPNNVIEKWVRYANVRVVLRPGFIARNVLSQRSPRDLKDALLALRRRLAG